MQSTIVMVNLFGAVALLLFGLSLVKDGVTRAFGARLRAGLAQGTNGAVRSFATGLVATLALQSSTATALMTASQAGFWSGLFLFRAKVQQTKLLQQSGALPPSRKRVPFPARMC